MLIILQSDRDKIANLIEEALRCCFNKQMMTPEMLSLSNLPSQTLLLPGPEFPRLQDNDKITGNAVTSSSDSVSSIPPKTSGLSDSINKMKLYQDEGEPPTITETGS